ncbi:MAG TPA: hypothetical protein VKJ00_08360, partial [Thermoanaerobaculia bacterium]|nr:hypothetical protein [Thermoanaerobaculia bacterium]
RSPAPAHWRRRSLSSSLDRFPPRARYPVGKHSLLLRSLPRFLPDRLLDFVRLKVFSLPTGFGALREVF